MTRTEPRFAIYAAPVPGCALADLGAGLLGYDAERGCEITQRVPEGAAQAEWHALTSEPRRYGFHGTLKAPFRLAPGKSLQDLEGAAAAFANTRRAVKVDLFLKRLGDFFALAPEGRPAALHALADAVVRDFDRFRAEPSSAELEKRARASMTAEQAQLMNRWGYPYVLDAFRFHMTLTGRVPAECAGAAESGLKRLIQEGLGTEPVALDLSDICIFEQAAPDARFVIRSRFPLRP